MLLSLLRHPSFSFSSIVVMILSST